jgi:2-oxoacid:acceptor oxidoreductase delta subunit (pyruvate/2-ketoisovalerate family)
MRKRPQCPLPEAPAAGGLATLEEARREAERCLSTHACQGCELCELFCPDLAITKDPRTGRPVIDLAFCKGCGLCAELCPKGAISMVVERET